jgi:hypothetical protein
MMEKWPKNWEENPILLKSMQFSRQIIRLAAFLKNGKATTGLIAYRPKGMEEMDSHFYC